MTTSRGVLVRMARVGKVFVTDEVETHALADVDLDIHCGEYLAIEGPSGCGKSTLLSIVGLLDTPTSGEFVIGDSPVSSLSPRDRAKMRNLTIGFVFQNFNLIGDLTVFENIELPLVYRKMPQPQRQELVRDALQKVGLEHRANHYPAQLSGGQQQRIAVARAVVGRPLLLLADEPTGNLDSSSGDAVMRLIGELHDGGTTVCIVTHDPHYADRALRTVHLFDGRVVNKTTTALTATA